METTTLKAMQQNIKKSSAKEIYYFQWTSSEPFTVMASDGTQYGSLTTIGYTYDLDVIRKLGLPLFNQCPFN